MKTWYCCECKKHFPGTQNWQTDTENGQPVGTHSDEEMGIACGGHMLIEDVDEKVFENFHFAADSSYIEVW